MQVEDVSWVGFSARGTPEQQGHLSIGDGLLGEIVIDDEGVHSVVPEVLTDGTTRVRGQELQRSGLRSGGSHDDSVFHGAGLLEDFDEVGDGGPLLTDGDVNAIELLLLVAGLEVGLLVDDGVDGDGCFSGLTVANDELSLASADGDETVDGLEAGLHRLVHGLAGNDAGGLELDSPLVVGLDGALAVNGVSESVEDSAKHFHSDGDVDDGSCALHDVAFLDLSGVDESAYLSLPRTTIPTLSVSRLSAMPRTPELNSTISPAWT